MLTLHPLLILTFLFADIHDMKMRSFGYHPVRLERRTNAIYTLSVVINKKKYSLLVDSGASDTYLSSENYIKSKFKLAKAVTGSGLLGGSLDYTYVDEIVLENNVIVKYGFYFRNLLYIQNSFISSGLGSIDGILGCDFLIKNGIMVDYSRGRMYIPKAHINRK